MPLTSDSPRSITASKTLSVALSGGGGASAQSGYIAFDLPVIHHATTGGTVPVRLVRRRGSAGSVQVTLSASDKFRAQGIQSYAGETVAFAAGEMTKVVNVPLNSVTLDGEAHFYLNCTVTNALIPGVRWHELNALVVVDDGSIWSGGTVLTDPTTQTIQTAAVDNSIIYLRTGTWDDFTVAGYTELYGNDGRKGTSFRDKTNVVIRNYPGESPIVTCSAPYGAGIFIRSNNYVHVSGLEITGTGENAFIPVYIKEITTDVPDEYVYVTNCHVHDWYGGDNTGGIRCDAGYRCVAFNNTIHDGYDTRQNSNTITAVPYGLHAGLHGYGPREFFIYQNTIYNVKRAMYRKDPSMLGGMTSLFARNFVYDIEGVAADYDYAGAKDLANYDMAVFENICIDCPAAKLKFSDNTGTDISERALIYNNLITNGRDIFTAGAAEKIEMWNNLVIGGTASTSVVMSLNGNNVGELTYADHNGYAMDYRYLFGRYAASFRAYNTFSAWQASDESASVDNQAPANPDSNGAKGAPVFVGVSDYHLDPSDTLFRNQGRFADESMGAYRLGYEQIGATS